MTTRYQHNPLSLMSEVAAALLRCEEGHVKATIGQVEKNLINIRITRTVLKKTLEYMIGWGLVSCEGFQYRKNVKSCEYRLSRMYGAEKLNYALIRYNADLSPHFPALKEVFAHA